MGLRHARSVGGVHALALLGLLAAASDGAAQDLAGRIAAAGTETLRFSYPAREDVEICDRGISVAGSRMMWRDRRRTADARCVRGTASAELRVENGVVRAIDVLDLDETADPGAVELGAVGAEDAVDYFVDLARAAGPRGVGEDAVFAAMLADVAEVWRDLLDIARDPSLRQDVRRASIFWLGQEAGGAVTAGIAAIAADEREEQEVREAAIFALSQQPDDLGVAALMDLARTAREAETRRSAMFWLAQSDDARVVEFFEEILLTTTR